jgi:hypothetical protein
LFPCINPGRRAQQSFPRAPEGAFGRSQIGKTGATIEKPRTLAIGDPAFAELEKTTAELISACQRGIEAARTLRGVA